eukprot:jgi/Botrbrau1/23639/Bobra.55_2s0026.1
MLVILLPVAVLLVVKAAGLFFYWIRDNFLVAKQLPTPPVDNIIVGHASLFNDAKVHRKMQELGQRYGNFRLRTLHLQHVVITDPHLIKIIFGHALCPAYLDRPVDEILFKMNEAFTDGMDGNVLTSKTDDPLWKAVRKAILSSMSCSHIKQAFQQVADVVTELKEALRRDGGGGKVPLDVDSIMLRESMDVIGLVAFRRDFGMRRQVLRTKTVDPFYWMTTAFLEISRVLLDPMYRLLWFRKEVREGRRALAQFRKLVASLTDELTSRGLDENDHSIGAELLRVRDFCGEPLTLARLKSEVGIMFAAGMDTTGHTVAWTLYLLSQHPDKEAKVLEELDSLGLLVTKDRPKPRPLEYADFSQIPYLAAVIKESMRMYTVVGLGPSRVVKQPMRLGPYNLPAGTILWAMIGAMHMNSSVWSDPHTFMPERMLEEGAEVAKDSPTSRYSHQLDDVPAKRFLPFGGGVRSCVGQSLAAMNMSATLVLLLSAFKFELAPQMGGPEGVKMAEVFRMTVVPDGGLWMTCTPREDL